MCLGPTSRTDAAGLVFVDVGAHMEFGEITEEDERRGLGHGGYGFPRADIDAEHGAGDGGVDGASGEFRFGGLQGGVGGGDFGPGFVDASGGSADGEAAADGFLLGADSVRLESFGARGLVLEILERGPGGFDASFGRPPLGPAQFHFRFQGSVVEMEQRCPDGDGIPGADQHLGHDAGLRCADGDEFGPGFDQSDRGHGIGESGSWRRNAGFHQRVVGLSADDRHGRQRHDGDRHEGKNGNLHGAEACWGEA